jgi:hypothetical protein
LFVVENAFQPAKEITVAARFAGRTDAIATGRVVAAAGITISRNIVALTEPFP